VALTLDTGGRGCEIIGAVNDVSVGNEGHPELYVCQPRATMVDPREVMQ
jgi:hypothetical protein